MIQRVMNASSQAMPRVATGEDREQQPAQQKVEQAEDGGDQQRALGAS